MTYKKKIEKVCFCFICPEKICPEELCAWFIYSLVKIS